MWVLNSIPALLAVVATFMPDLARGVSTSYFAVIAPLNILMANSFYDAIDAASGDMEKHVKARSSAPPCTCTRGVQTCMPRMRAVAVSRRASHLGAPQ